MMELIKEGLYLESYERTNSITGATMTIRKLHSVQGYCFYDLADEYYGEEGNRIPEENVTHEMRTYYQYMSIAPNRSLDDFVSVFENGDPVENTEEATIAEKGRL